MTYDDQPTSSAHRPTGMRIGDAEREQAAEALRRHHAEGRLSDAEFEQRVARCYDARTAGELDQLFADLPRHDRGMSSLGGSRELFSGWQSYHPAAIVLAVLAGLWLLGGLFASVGAWGAGVGGFHHPFIVPLIALFVVWRLVGRRRRRRSF